jgi:hypothetical protein
MTTPIDPYANATASLPSATQSIIPATGLGLNDATINTSDLNVSSAGGGVVLGYTGSPGVGDLYFSLSPSSTTDVYGNTVNTGLSVNSGSLTGVSLVGVQMDSTSTLQNTQINQPQVLSPSISGGTAASLTQTLTNTNGGVLGYSSGSSAVTFATNGNYTWTCPTGITQISVACYGAGGGGGGGGNSNGPEQGGESAGGGEYAAEPNFAVIPGSVYSIIIGQGGQGGTTGNPGQSGGPTVFQNLNGGGSQVTANPGLAGVNYLGGVGGSGSTNTIHFDGGDGADASGNTGGAGGGSAGSPTSEGADGTESSSSSGGAAGSNPPGGGGGTGGNSGGNGTTGGSPGGGGGGAGYNSVTTGTKTYASVGPYSYYGPNAMGYTPNGLHSKTVLYQGQPGVNSAQGYQYSFFSLDYTQIMSDLSGVVVESVEMTIKCLYSYYASGVYCEVGYVGYYDHGNTGNDASTKISNFLIQQNETVTHNFGLNGGIGTALQTGAARSICLGPGAISPWQDYYGSFDTGANGGVTPEIIVNYAASNGSTAGSGSDGQCVLSYNNSSAPTFVLSISSQTSADSFGNPYDAGFTGQQFTVLGTQAPSTVATTISTTASSAAAIASNTSGQIITSNNVGMTGTLPQTQVDVASYAVNSNNVTANLSKAWLVPAGDPQLGTMYEITVPFAGIMNSSSIWNIGFNHGTVSSTTAFTNICPIGAAFTAGGDALAGTIRLTLTCLSVGTSGHLLYVIDGSIGDASENRGATSTGTLMGIGTLTTFNTNNNNTLAVACEYTTGTTGMTGITSRFLRYGP